MPTNSIKPGNDWTPAPIESATTLYDVAHARSGDKGNTLNVIVIPFDETEYEPLDEYLTEVRVKEHFSHLMEDGSVTKYRIPALHCMNFVLTEILDGGVTKSKRFDRHGKTLSRYMLQLPVDINP